jgi:hypothetical protein
LASIASAIRRIEGVEQALLRGDQFTRLEGDRRRSRQCAREAQQRRLGRRVAQQRQDTDLLAAPRLQRHDHRVDRRTRGHRQPERKHVVVAQRAALGAAGKHGAIEQLRPAIGRQRHGLAGQRAGH